MPDDKAVKSSFEIAMERLKKSDADAGITRQTLSDAQKAAIAEIRNFYEAKIAETELLHQNTLRSLKKDSKLPPVFATIIPEANKLAESAEFLAVNTLKQKYGSGAQGNFDTYLSLTKEVLGAMELV